MRPRSLIQLLEATQALAHPTRIVIIGSSSLLPLGILEPTLLRAHYQQTPLGERDAATAGRNFQLLLSEPGHP